MKKCEDEKKILQIKEYFLWAYRAPWACAPVWARRARLSIALFTIRWLVVDLAAQIIETLAVWTLTHHQPRLYATSARLGALQAAGKEEVVFYKWVWERKEIQGCFPSYLPPAAIDPLWTRPGLTGLLLIGPTVILTVVGSVAILILAHYYTPLETSRTCTGALLLQREKNAQCQRDWLSSHYIIHTETYKHPKLKKSEVKLQQDIKSMFLLQEVKCTHCDEQLFSTQYMGGWRKAHAYRKKKTIVRDKWCQMSDCAWCNCILK